MAVVTSMVPEIASTLLHFSNRSLGLHYQDSYELTMSEISQTTYMKEGFLQLQVEGKQDDGEEKEKT